MPRESVLICIESLYLPYIFRPLIIKHRIILMMFYLKKGTFNNKYLMSCLEIMGESFHDLTPEFRILGLFSMESHPQNP